MPKRSSGCFECRKRKVRCDEAKPECVTCVRRGTKCPGYRPVQSFIFHTFNARTVKPGITKEDDNLYKYAKKSGQKSVVHVLAKDIKPLYTPVPRPVSPIAIDRIQHLSHFLSLYLPDWEHEVLTPPSALILSLPTIPASRKNFLAAMDALSAAQLAVSNKSYSLINRTRSLYGTALGQLMVSIAQPDSAQEDETLLSTYLLALYEVFVGVTSGHGFFYHVQGLLRLFLQRGPSRFKSKLSMEIFHGTRYYSLGIGFHMRKASILDSPEWLAVTAKEAKTDPYVALMDVTIHVPRILERTDKLARAGGSLEEFKRIIVDSQLLATSGKNWLANFEKDGPRYTKVDARSINGFLNMEDDRTFDTAFFFHSFATSNTYLGYWSTMLILQSNTFGLLRKLTKLGPKDLFMWSQELSGYADCICRGVPFNCQPEAGYTGRLGTLMPLGVARKYFEARGATKEIAWCEKAYYGTKVDGLYSPPLPIKPVKGFAEFVQNSARYI